MEGLSSPHFYSVTPQNIGSKVHDFFALLVFYIKDFFAGPGGAFLQFILILIAVVATFILIYFYIRTEEIEKRERLKTKKQVKERQANSGKEVSEQGWEKIISYLERGSEAEWRMAILEADNLLDELLTELKYTGDGVGDKLKMIEPSHMRNLDAAWEAHKIRNRIAHDGSKFPITYREARRVVSLYEQVFREFGYV